MFNYLQKPPSFLEKGVNFMFIAMKLKNYCLAPLKYQVLLGKNSVSIAT
jgi:hypothetical protein